MKTIFFTELSTTDKQLLREAVSRLTCSLNKITNPSTCAIAKAEHGYYFGNNVFLSNDTLACAEANALASAVAAGDRRVSTLYLVISRIDSEPKIVSPCGNCRQWLYDFARLNNQTIKVLSATSKLDRVVLTDSEELLPEGFQSAGLGRMIGESA